MTVDKRSRTKSADASRIGVLVLGMHRSGTSALTRVLNLLGCDLPSTLMNPATSNETGHWESVAVMKLNDEILQSAGSSWHDWLPFNPGWYSSPKAADYKEKALAVLENEFGRSSLFVLKDPRICRFAPFWIDVIQTAGVRPVIVNQVRNPLEVAGSLSQRNGIDPQLGHLLWLRHVLEAEAGSRGLTRFHSSYEGLLAGWPALASGMQDALGLSWPRLSAMASEEISAFLTAKLRHHVESPKSVTGNPLLSSWLRDSFSILNRWTEDGEAEADHAELDRIRAELDGAAPAFGKLILSGERRAQELQSARQELEQGREELSTAAAELAQRIAELEESHRALSEAQAALTRSYGELNSVRDQLSQTQSALAQRRAEADEVTAQLQAARESLAAAESARGKETERAERLASELEAERSRIATRNEEIATLTRLLQEREAQLSAALERSREETASIERRLAEIDQDRKSSRERAERLADELEEERRRSNTELNKLRTERGIMESRLAERFSELAVMTRLLQEKENAVRSADQQLAWLREVSGTLLQASGSKTLKGRLAALLPASVRLRNRKERLKQAGIFDPDAYLAANPDVADGETDPLRHYIEHGMAEGRHLNIEQHSGEFKGDHEERK